MLSPFNPGMRGPARPSLLVPSYWSLCGSQINPVLRDLGAGTISVKMQASKVKQDVDNGKAEPGTWSWWKEWTGYLVTVLPYVSAGLVLIQNISVWVKAAILFVFACAVLAIRVVHEKAGVEVTGPQQREKAPK